MARKNRNTQAKIEYAEINARREGRRKPAKARAPAPSDPEAVDCTQHDDFAWSVYQMRGLFSFHPQDKRLNAALRFSLKFIWWGIHKARQS